MVGCCSADAAESFHHLGSFRVAMVSCSGSSKMRFSKFAVWTLLVAWTRHLAAEIGRVLLVTSRDVPEVYSILV